MTKKRARQDVIIREVSLHNRVLLRDLAETLDVSSDTVRRDIRELDERGLLKQVHGGAIANGYRIKRPGRKKSVYAAGNKSIIAAKAVSLVRAGSVNLVSGGTTNLELMRQLPNELEATFFTSSIPIALELMSHPNIELIFLGGQVNAGAQIALGGKTINALAELRVENLFLGTGYLDSEFGLSEFDREIVELKKAMIRSARRVISLTISEKLETTNRYKVCDLSAIQVLVTELDPTDSALDPYRLPSLQLL
ncbi:MAG: DeoR/GlpR family DNA-binding transcription regulator [Bacteroidota bacterium]